MSSRDNDRPSEYGERVRANPDDGRAAWVEHLTRLCEPVILSLAAGTLRERMPVEAVAARRAERVGVTHLEAVGRTLAGLAPWLAADLDGEEGRRAATLADAARRGLTRACDPRSPDHIDFTTGPQNLVDASFLALGLLRAPNVLWAPLPDETKRSLIASMVATRKFVPVESNWLLFSALIEVWLRSVGEAWLAAPIDRALTRHEEWFKGDGAYGDGPSFRWDYYNSYVIQPYLIEAVERVGDEQPAWAAMREPIFRRAARFAEVQERMIGADGTFPPIGRSIAYRGGAFHHLALMALRRQLPESLRPAQVRGALAAVHARTLDAPGTFDGDGWLRIGLAGSQPSLAEGYISTGSLYLCTCSFLPLGLPADDLFWTDPPAGWTQQRIWSGEDLPADHHG